MGVKTGMQVREGKLLCPTLQILEPDPWKYRNIHVQLRDLISQYTTNFSPKSIDEFILNLEGFPSFRLGMHQVGLEIKQKIKSQIGEWLTVSIGIGPNRFLAKLAANLKKPDGLEEINFQNYHQIYQNLSLIDLNGIKNASAIRLNNAGIYNLNDFYSSSIDQLKSAFQSIIGYYWYLRLRGWEIDDVDFGRKSFGNMYSLPTIISTPEEISPILHKLVEKCSFRMRHSGYATRGVHVALLYRNHTFWHHGSVAKNVLFNSNDIYKYAYKIMTSSPYQLSVANISVSLFNLTKSNFSQLDLFNQLTKKINITKALDTINEKWGNFVITPGMMIGTQNNVVDRVAFGNINELEEFICTE
jgi:DNA polymerase-4